MASAYGFADAFLQRGRRAALAGSFFKFWTSLLIFIPPAFWSTAAGLSVEWCGWATGCEKGVRGRGQRIAGPGVTGLGNCRPRAGEQRDPSCVLRKVNFLTFQRPPSRVFFTAQVLKRWYSLSVFSATSSLCTSLSPFRFPAGHLPMSVLVSTLSSLPFYFGLPFLVSSVHPTSLHVSPGLPALRPRPSLPDKPCRAVVLPSCSASALVMLPVSEDLRLMWHSLLSYETCGVLNQLCSHLPFYLHVLLASVSEARFILLCKPPVLSGWHKGGIGDS